VADFKSEQVAGFKSESPADFIPEWVADLRRNQHLVEVPLGMSLKGLHDVIRAAGCLRRNSTLTRFFIAYNSCRNRHCPKCQGAAAKEWLADREAELLPVP